MQTFTNQMIPLRFKEKTSLESAIVKSYKPL